jgi:hypothetical protein
MAEHKFKKYEQGYELAENEYLLKIRDDGTGFMTRFNKSGSMPVAFDTWEDNKWNNTKNPKLQIYIIGEVPREGWKIVKWRFGMSQNWATVMHPLGFTIEIYLQQLLELIERITIVKGELIGRFEWKNHELLGG